MSHFKNKLFFQAISSSFILACISILFSCQKFEPERIVKLITDSITSVTYTSCSAQGTIIDVGDSYINQHGFCWSDVPDPDLGDYNKNLGPIYSAGKFSSDLNDLSANTKYYVRAFADNTAGTGTTYGNQVSFTTSSVDNTITDFDGNVYNMVQIGSQYWMKENLKTTHYADGTAIPLVEEEAAWNTIKITDDAYCYYDNNSSNGYIYGALYTWAAAMNGASSSSINPSNVQGVCPTGWHLPSDNEWKELEMFLGMSQPEAEGTDFRGTDEGGKLKEIGTTHWTSPNTGATNSSGFTAMPGGFRFSGDDFTSMGDAACFWSSTESRNSYVWSRILFSDYSKVYRYDGYSESAGMSVRCLRDE